MCGYLLIEWFPISYPFHFADFLVGLIIYPLEFFAASLAFFIGLSRQDSTIISRNSSTYEKDSIRNFIISFLNGGTNLVLFGLSFLYGMISSRTLRWEKGKIWVIINRLALLVV